ncbi:family 10 glycosylhydrolase [Thiovibrio frasassiensis]|uniref:Family 10 glycosylhydrolase n=1 Tax=Thiovibrio frasassiensis TaxID=2984131 RepID=A0A9X4MGM3_9BACT|nr:family 10 glycosylhydrolase [Thiovibrio frasassiensis]MDG4476262.1 family 10 glycosylhydrolase [Thiovibrio frasassiensis]
MPSRKPFCFPRALLPSLALLLLVAACAPRLQTSAWVTRFDLDTPEKAASVCSEAKQAGFDQLLVQVRGRGDAMYQSEIAPRAENLAQAPADFDPLGQLLGDCAPLPLHAWLNTYYLWGDTTPPDSAEHPGHPSQPWILTDNTGRPVSSYSEQEKRLGWIEGSYADPASAEYRALFIQAVKELLTRYPVAGIHLDFIRYPGAGYGKSDALADKFARVWGVDPRLLPEHLNTESINAWLAGTQPPADRILTMAALFWNEFRAGQVTQLLREVRHALDQHGDTTISLSAAVFPEPSGAYLENGQEWQAWAGEGLVDALYPMAYFGESDRVANQLREITLNTPRPPKVALWAGLGALSKGKEGLGDEARIAGEYGYDGVALFSLGHILKKSTAAPWVESVRAPRRNTARAEHDREKPLRTAPPTFAPPNLQSLQAIVRKGLGGAGPPRDLEAKLALRLEEYAQAREQAIPQTLKLLKTWAITLPENLDLGGIFRYASPLDSPARRQEQEKLCEKGCQRLLAGEELATVAREISQDSSKSMGGLLAPRFLDPLNPQDRELARLPPHSVSRVMRVANGFWCYRVQGSTPGRKIPFCEAPWEAKRILFRRALSERMGAGE